MKYFKLYPTVKFVKTSKNSCLYDFINGQMIKINNDLGELIQNCKNNSPVENNSKEIELLNKLEEMGLGSYTDKITFQEEFENTDIDLRTVILPQNNVINKLFIELGSECNLNCIFCNEDNKLIRKTGCKRWTKYDESLQLDDWEKVLCDISKLKCKQLVFIGGNPLLQIDNIKKLILISKRYGFDTFILYTNGTLIDDKVIEIVQKHNVILNIQILSFNERTIENIGIDKSVITDIDKNLKKLVNNGINIIGEILITSYNENEIEEIKESLKNKYKIKYVKIEYIYNKPFNQHFSKKYIPAMYNKTTTFTKVTKQKFNLLQVWNPCLKGQLVIKGDGEVLICPMIRRSIGNITQNEIYELLKKPEFMEYVEVSKNKIEKCNECSYKFNCLDCRAIEMSATDNLYGLEFCDIKD